MPSRENTLKLKITATEATKFIRTAAKGKRLWDAELPGFWLRSLGNGTGRWQVKYSVLSGEQREITIGRFPAMSVAIARESASTAINNARSGVDPLAVKEQAKAEAARLRAQTIRAYLDGPYSVYLARRKQGKETRQMIERNFPEWLDRPMTQLTAADLSQWHAAREVSGRKWATISRAWDAVRALLNHAAKAGIIDANPLAGEKLERPALSEDELVNAGSSRRYLSADEVRGFFTGLEAYQNQIRAQRRNSRSHGKSYLPDLDAVPYVDHVTPWFLTMYYTGFRPGDLFGLRWEHVNLTFKTIRKVIEKTAHIKPEIQTFSLSDRAAEVLQAWHRQCGKPVTGYVFTSRVTGRRMDKAAMQKPWDKVRKLGGLPDELQLYTLRHHFASTLVMNGVDLLTVSKLMAHSDIKTTIEHYGHLRPDRAREVVNDFANGFGEDYAVAAVRLA